MRRAGNCGFGPDAARQVPARFADCGASIGNAKKLSAPNRITQVVPLAQARSTVTREFATFAGIGAAAFFVDAGVLHVLAAAGAGLYLGRLGSWLCAATFTWYLNRRLTFRDARRDPPMRQWARFLAANSVGGLLNYGTYAVCIAASDTARRWPILAVGAGSVAGLLANFMLSRRMVFRSRA